MVTGKYLRTKHKIVVWHDFWYRRIRIWGEEEGKLFAFQRSVYLNSSLALDAVKKPSEWKLFVTKTVP